MILKLGTKHRLRKYYRIPLNGDPTFTFDPFYANVNSGSLMVDYSEIINVYDLKVGIYSKLKEYREIYMYQRSISFLYLCLNF